MPTEIEAKLKVDSLAEVTKKLKRLGAEFLQRNSAAGLLLRRCENKFDQGGPLFAAAGGIHGQK